MAVAQAQAAAAAQNPAAVQALVAADTPETTTGPQPSKDNDNFLNIKHRLYSLRIKPFFFLGLP